MNSMRGVAKWQRRIDQGDERRFPGTRLARCNIGYEAVGTYWVIVWTLAQGFSCFIVKTGNLGRVIRQVVNTPRGQMDPAVCDPTENNFVCDVQVHNQTQWRSLLSKNRACVSPPRGDGIHTGYIP